MTSVDDDFAETRNEMDALYRERAHLVSFVAALYPSIIIDHEEWPIIYISTPEGQVSWHLKKSDLDLFKHVPYGYSMTCDAWDGHTTPEKYERIRQLVESIHGMRLNHG